jgi:uncharacterized membrane protein YphA (DoxX/SURF4 family)
MITGVWIAQILLALAFLLAGGMKVFTPKEKLMARMAEGFSLSFFRVLGVVEILGAIGIILPALTGILPWLTPLAALGFVLTMIGAVIVHLRQREYGPMLVNLLLLTLAVFVIYGRVIAIPVVM